MREVTFTLDKLNSGLRKDDSQPMNSDGLTELYNMKCGKLGLVAYEPVTDRKGVQSISWPFPNLLIGTHYKFLCTSTQIYELSSVWAQTLRVTTTGGYLWEMIDFGTYIIFTNGTKLVIRDPSDGSYTAYDYLSTVPRFSTGINLNGQIIIGNIKTTWNGCGINSVCWAAIGTNDFTVGTDNVKGAVNEAGFRTSMHWDGEVYKILQIGNSAVIYGDAGIGALFTAKELFGYRELKDFGLASRYSVAGDKNKHLFIASDGTAYLVGFKVSAYGSTYEEIVELGYKEFFSAMTSANIVVSYNSIKDEFYISDDTTCYVLTSTGLSQCYQLITSVKNNDAVVDDTEDYEARLTTDSYDFQERGIKTVMGVELGVYHPSNGGTYYGYGRIDYKYDKTADFTTGSDILMNPSGVITQPTAGENFKFGCKFTNYANVKIDYMKVDVKMTDRRFMRGPVASNLVQVTE